MAGEWTRTTVGDVCQRVTKGTTPTTVGGRFVESGIAFVKVESITDDGHLDNTKFAFIDNETNQMLARSVLREDDVLFTIAGTIGRVARVTREVLPANTNQAVAIVRPDRDIVDSRFLYYVLRDDVRVAHAQSRVVQSVQANFSLAELSAVEMPLPPRAEQHAIAHILGTLDEKIELNRRMNERLEAMARAIFKSWFVDFDPVRAKAVGRDPGLPGEIADLFPDSFEDSELGEIPAGFAAQSIYEIADVVYGAPFASSQFNTDGIGRPLVRIRDLVSETPGVWTPEVHPKGYIVRTGDIVVGMDGEFRAYVWGGVEAWLNQRVCVFAPKRGVSAAFVLHSIIDPLAHVEATETATTVIHLGKSDIDQFSVVVPSAPLLVSFNRICQPWYDCVAARKRECRTLAALRDTLLPKLISGEIRVKDAERIAAAAV